MRNWHLYPKALQEMARVIRPGTGRVCLLTQDKKCITKVGSSISFAFKCHCLIIPMTLNFEEQGELLSYSESKHLS